MRDNQNFDYHVKYYDMPPKNKTKTKPPKQQQQQHSKIEVVGIQQTHEYTVLKLYTALQFHMNHDSKSGTEKSIIHM